MIASIQSGALYLGEFIFGDTGMTCTAASMPGSRVGPSPASHGSKPSGDSVTGTGGTFEKDVPLSFLGFGPAPSYASKTATQNRIGYLYREEVAPGVRPFEEAEADEAKRQAKQAYRLAEVSGDQSKILAAEKTIHDAGVKRISTLPGDVYMFSRLSATSQKAILENAPPDERAKYLLHVSSSLQASPEFNSKYYAPIFKHQAPGAR